VYHDAIRRCHGNIKMTACDRFVVVELPSHDKITISSLDDRGM
jgi:hypothetical protein